MAAKTPMTLIYTDIVTALSQAIESKYIFLGRPDISKNVDSPMNKFMVVELPISIKDIAFGNKKFVLTTTGVLYLFTKGKRDNTMNLNATSDFISDVESLFPYNGLVCSISEPTVRLRGADEYGYQVTSITFALQTKANVFKN